MKKLLTAIAALALSVGLVTAPVTLTAKAEETSEPIVSSEVVDDSVIESVESPTIDDSVVIEETLDEEETSVNTPQTSDNAVEEDKDESGNKDLTLDDILEFAGTMAEESGLGDKWAAAVQNLKNAITAQQFTLSTALTILEIIILAGYIIYKVIVNKKVMQISKYLNDLNVIETTNGKTLVAQTTALKEMSSSEQKVAEIGEKLVNKQKRITTAQEYTNDALLHIVEGINFSPERKKAAIRALNKSNEALDGGNNNDGTAQ